MNKKYTYFSRVTPDRKGDDIIRKEVETGKEEVVATVYDAGLVATMVLFLNL